MKKQFVLVHGPTGVGKSDIITRLGAAFAIEIVNCDVGQFYEPFSIGTAKPDWKNQDISHHLFDIIKTPKDFSVSEYRELIIKTMEEIWDRKHVPILVGGSGFYGKSLFFPPLGTGPSEQAVYGTWEELHKLDPERAAQIHQHDTYRIGRALQLIKHQNIKPSELQPIFNPPEGNCLIVFLTRDRQQLYERINARTAEMLASGWLEEVANIQGTDWQNFLYQKKLIGYTEILEYLKKGDLSNKAQEIMTQKIAQKTRHYAKRQETFWSMFKKLLTPYVTDAQLAIIEINLSKDEQALELTKKLKTFLSL
ncbi:MAG: tRNA (adenosine(37)-N6)-dimethylallyltransferase MiaA [Candidatus Babeliales bacterium]|jgi:tRNA dimethylallyltransferase